MTCPHAEGSSEGQHQGSHYPLRISSCPRYSAGPGGGGSRFAIFRNFPQFFAVFRKFLKILRNLTKNFTEINLFTKIRFRFW